MGGTKTSVTIPDDLLIEAKVLTVTQKTSVQDLLIFGLRRELAARKAAHAPDDNGAKGTEATASRPAAKAK